MHASTVRVYGCRGLGFERSATLIRDPNPTDLIGLLPGNAAAGKNAPGREGPHGKVRMNQIARTE